jgi:chromosome segregation ATPase
MLETQVALIKPGYRDEPGWLERVKSLEYKILAVRKDLETEQNNGSTLQHMLLTRQNNINLLSEPLSTLKENLSKIASEKDEADNTLYRNLVMYKSMNNKMKSLRDTMKELRDDRELQKVENLTKFSDRAILIEFIKRQKKQEEIKKLVNKNEKELGNLEKVLRDTTESEEINKEIEACNAYIARQEQMFLKLKKMTNVTSIEDMPSHYGYLNETKRTLIANQGMLEQKIENAQNELNLRNNELNNAILENLSAAVDAESRFALRKINIIEENILEKNRLLYDHKKQIDKKETLIAGICAILSRIKFQLQPDIPMKDIPISEVEKEMESISNRLSEMKDKEE